MKQPLFLTCLLTALLLTACASPLPTPTAAPAATPSPAPEPTPTPALTAPSPEPESELSGSAADVLKAVLDGTTAELPMGMDSPVTAENCEGMLGLTPEELVEYVVSAQVSTAAISTFAHEAAVAECKDGDAAETVKGLIAKGFDSKKWICVTPDKSAVVRSGNYVFLAVSEAASVDALLESFTALAGAVGETDTFFEFQG